MVDHGVDFEPGTQPGLVVVRTFQQDLQATALRFAGVPQRVEDPGSHEGWSPAVGGPGSGTPFARPVDDVECIDLITALEQVKRSAEAVQAELTSQVDTMRRAQEAEAGVPKARQGRGVGAEIGLARQESTHRGARLVGLAKALREMPHTYAQVAAGNLSEYRATLLAKETACLSLEDRARVDAALCGSPDTLAGMGNRGISALARRLAAKVDQEALVRRAAKAATDRTVTIRPAPDQMAYLTALLPVQAAVAVYASLTKAADTTNVNALGIPTSGDSEADDDAAPSPGGGRLAEGVIESRGRGQIMADELTERILGKPAADVPVHVGMVMTDATLLQGDDEPAIIPGYGPVPAIWARDVIAATADAQTEGATIRNSQNDLGSRTGVFIRRLYTAPTTGALIAMDSAQRRAPAGLAQFIRYRDGHTCRTPWCDAPTRHTDHVVDHASGGPTREHNLQSQCAAGNYAKAAPGWTSTTEPARPSLPSRASSSTAPAADPQPRRFASPDKHVVITTTPTGHTYRSAAPMLPGTYPPAVKRKNPCAPMSTRDVGRHERPGDRGDDRRRVSGRRRTPSMANRSITEAERAQPP